MTSHLARFAFTSIRTAVVVVVILAATIPHAHGLDQLNIGGQTGSQIFFNSTLPRTFNFGVTGDGATAGITIDRILVTLAKGQQTTNPVLLQVYSGLGGTGTLLGSGSMAANSFSNQFATVPITLSSTISMPAGYYSVRMTTVDVNDYLFKATAMTLTSTSGASISSALWVQDSNQSGDAGTTLVASGTVLATWTLGTNSVGFGNYRVGGTLNQSVSLVNNALATSNNVTQALAATGTISGGTSALSGLPSPYLSVGGTSSLTVGLNSAITGPNSGTATLNFMSVSGTTATTGTTAIGTGAIGLSGTGYNWANAVYTGTSLAFGMVHQGASAISGTVAIGNQTIANAAYQDALTVTGSTGNASVNATGFTGLTASTNGSSKGSLVVTASAASVGSLASTVALSLVSDANGVAGLTSGTATVVGSPSAITTSGTVYSGQSIWKTNGGGQWGTLASGFGTNWQTYNGSPGLDSAFANTARPRSPTPSKAARPPSRLHQPRRA